MPTEIAKQILMLLPAIIYLQLPHYYKMDEILKSSFADSSMDDILQLSVPYRVLIIPLT